MQAGASTGFGANKWDTSVFSNEDDKQKFARLMVSSDSTIRLWKDVEALALAVLFNCFTLIESVAVRQVDIMCFMGHSDEVPAMWCRTCGGRHWPSSALCRLSMARLQHVSRSISASSS